MRLGLDDDLASAVARLRPELDAADPRAAGRTLFTQGHERTHTPFVTRPSGLDALAQPRFLLGQPLVELRILDGLGRQPLLLALEKRRVVSRPRGQPAAIEFDDAGRQPLQEHTVVRHEQHGAGIVREEGFEPRHHLDVEMIRRFVEDQKIRRADERTRQQHPPAPAAGERGDARVAGDLQAGRAQAARVARPASARLPGPRALRRRRRRPDRRRQAGHPARAALRGGRPPARRFRPAAFRRRR